MSILNWFAASLIFRIAEVVFIVILYEIIRHLVIDKVKQISERIKRFFKK